jgi:hypothetical protein
MTPLDAALAGAARVLDGDIARSGAAVRVGRNVLAAVAAPAMRNIPWFALAAALVLAAGLGSLADLAFLNVPAGVGGQEVVVLDPLVFGPAEEVEQQ